MVELEQSTRPQNLMFETREGKVVAVWFRCQALPFRQEEIGPEREREMLRTYRDNPGVKIHGIQVEDLEKQPFCFHSHTSISPDGAKICLDCFYLFPEPYWQNDGGFIREKHWDGESWLDKTLKRVKNSRLKKILCRA